MSDLLGQLWTAANIPGPERTVLALSQSEARALLARVANVYYRCPRCERAARWTDGRAVAHGDECDEFWCQTCGAEVPLEECEVIPR